MSQAGYCDHYSTIGDAEFAATALFSFLIGVAFTAVVAMGVAAWRSK